MERAPHVTKHLRILQLERTAVHAREVTSQFRTTKLLPVSLPRPCTSLPRVFDLSDLSLLYSDYCHCFDKNRPTATCMDTKK